jgi:hypothetical protein
MMLVRLHGVAASMRRVRLVWFDADRLDPSGVLELTCRPSDADPVVAQTGRVNVTEEAPELPGLVAVLSVLPAACATP